MDVTMYLKAFIVGGALCAVGELLVLFTKLTPARILVLYVVAGVVLTAMGLYTPLAEWAGAGATTPLTGFGHLLAKGTKEAVLQKGLMGALTGGMTAAAGGLTAAIAFGAIAGVVRKPKSK